MSVDSRRFAAAKRTAAERHGARTIRLASWLLIVPLLALFSFSVVAGASGFGEQPNYARAVKTVAPPAGEKHGGGVFVVVKATAEPRSSLDSLTKRFTKQAVCWITSSQLATVSQHYATGRLAVDIDGNPLSVVTVSGANEHDLRSYLGSPSVQCTLVQVAHVFFLPFDAHGS